MASQAYSGRPDEAGPEVGISSLKALQSTVLFEKAKGEDRLISRLGTRQEAVLASDVSGDSTLTNGYPKQTHTVRIITQKLTTFISL